MNISNGALFFGAGISLDKWRNDIASMRRDIIGLKDNVVSEARQMDSSLKIIGAGVAGYFSAQTLLNFTKQVISVRGEFQKTEIAFATMLGSQEKASALMAQMVDLAAKTPFSLQEVSSGAKQLLAFKVPAEEVVDTLTRMGNIASGLSVPISRINLVFGQVKAKGRLMGDDLRQFTEAGIPMVAELAKKFGKTSAEITDMVTAGKIGFTDVKEVLFDLTNEGGMFFNLMEKQSASLSGKVSNLGDNFQQMINKIGESQEGILGNGIDALSYLVDNYDTLLEILGLTIASYGIYRTALMAHVAWTTLAQGAVLQQALAQGTLTTAQAFGASATVALQRATAGLNATLLANPIGIVVGLLAGLSYVIYKNVTATTTYMDLQKKLADSTAKHNQSVDDQKSKINALVAVIKNKNTTDEQAKKALNQINALTNNRIKGLTVESIRLGKSSEAIKGYIGMLELEAKAKALIETKQEAEKRKKEILSTSYNDLSLGDRFGNFREVGDIKLTAQERKRKAMIQDLISAEKAISGASKQLDDLNKKGVDVLGLSSGNVAEEVSDSTKDLKEKNAKHQRELAEVYSKGSIADLEQRIELWNNALKRASNGEVKVRARDKFGDEKETGEKVSITHAVEQVEILEKEKRKAEKLIRAKNFDEDIAELERQWSLKEILAQKYSKTYSDTIFPELKGSYFDDISKKFEELNKKANEGVKLSDEELEQWKKLKDILDSLNGTKSPLEMYKKSIEELKSSSKSAYQLLGYLKEELAHLADDNSLSGLQKKLLINEEIETATATVKEQYKDFLKTTESFEAQRTEIQKRHSEMRQQIYADNTLSEPEKQKAVNKTFSNESTDVSQAFLDSIVNTEAWATNFDQIGGLALEQFKRIRAELLAQIQTLVSSGVDANDPAFQQIINRLKELDDVANKNPFTGLINSWNKFKEALKDGDNSLKGTAGKIAQGADMINQAMSMGLGMAQDLGIEFNEETKAIIGDVSKVIGGVGELANGIKNMDPVSIIKGIGSVISGISGLFNGDRKKEKNIQAWAKEVESLKRQYEDLTRAIERSAGEANLTAQRRAVESLKQQQLILAKMAKEESDKKKSDGDKVNQYQDQIRAIDNQIEDLINNFKNSITGTDFRSMSENLASALIEAFGKGEDAVTAFDKVVDDVMKNAVANALRIKILEPVVQQMVDKLYSSMGFGNGGASAEQEEQMKGLEDKLKAVNEKYKKATLFQKPLLAIEKQKLEQQIEALKKQMQNNQMSGSFDGLTDAERDEIKAMGQGAMQQYIDALKQYEDLFGNAQQNATTLTGAVKGVTEETASIIAGLMNAMRIAQGEALQVNINLLDTCKNALIMLTQIEINTRHLGQIRTEITQMNLKIQNNSLRGVGLV